MTLDEGAVRDLDREKADLLALLQAVARRRPEKPLDPRDIGRAVAAAECVATAAGRPPNPMPDALTAWYARHPGAPPLPLLTEAVKAVDRILAERRTKELEDLRARLQGR